MSYAGNLIHTCAIRRATQTVSAGAVDRGTYASIATGVRCLIQVMQSAEGHAAKDDDGRRMYQVFFLPGQDVQTADILTAITGVSAASLGSANLRVTGPPIDPSGFGVNMHVPCVGHDSGDYR